MPEIKLGLRPANIPADTEEICRISNIYDDEPQTVSEFNRMYSAWNPVDPRLRLVAENEDGKIVGTSNCRRKAQTAAGTFFLHLYVDPSAIGRGVGSALLSECEQFASENGGKRVTAFVSDHLDRAKSFATKNEYELSRHLFGSILDLSQINDSQIDLAITNCKEKSGVSFTTLSEVGVTDESKRRLHHICFECDKDEPGTAEFGGHSFEDFENHVFGAEWFRPEGAIIATKHDEWVGVHTLGPLKESPAADINVDFTGVLREHRGSGIALAMKMLGIRYAKSIGGTKVLTHNDSTNIPMLKVNEKLGYKSQPGWLLMSKSFTRGTE